MAEEPIEKPLTESQVANIRWLNAMMLFERLEAAARQATDRSDATVVRGCEADPSDSSYRIGETICLTPWGTKDDAQVRADAEFIAAAHPAAILQLLDCRESEREEKESLYKRFGEMTDLYLGACRLYEGSSNEVIRLTKLVGTDAPAPAPAPPEDAIKNRVLPPKHRLHHKLSIDENSHLKKFQDDVERDRLHMLSDKWLTTARDCAARVKRSFTTGDLARLNLNEDDPAQLVSRLCELHIALQAGLQCTKNELQEAKNAQEAHSCEALAGGALDAQADAEKRMFAANKRADDAEYMARLALDQTAFYRKEVNDSRDTISLLEREATAQRHCAENAIDRAEQAQADLSHMRSRIAELDSLRQRCEKAEQAAEASAKGLVELESLRLVADLAARLAEEAAGVWRGDSSAPVDIYRQVMALRAALAKHSYVAQDHALCVCGHEFGNHGCRSIYPRFEQGCLVSGCDCRLPMQAEP